MIFCRRFSLCAGKFSRAHSFAETSRLASLCPAIGHSIEVLLAGIGDLFNPTFEENSKPHEPYASLFLGCANLLAFCAPPWSKLDISRQPAHGSHRGNS
jgi:hypothetical protein